ncbi:MAG: MerR family transcriptional regulator [bacterium]
MEGYLTIGKICRETGMSTSRLRYYESLGLIKPDIIDPKTDYRYYSLSQFREIEILKLCTQMNFPLKKIKELKEEGDLNKFYDFIKLQKYRTKKAIRQAQAAYDNIEWLYEALNDYFCQAEQKQEPYQLHIKKRTVLMSCPEELPDEILAQDDTLQRGITLAAADELVAAPYSRRQYGYLLDKDSLLAGKISLKGKYIELKRYIMNPERKLFTIPEGDYLCLDVQLFSNASSWTAAFCHYLQSNKYTVKAVYASDHFFNFLERSKSLIRIECLLQKKA